MTPRVGSAEVIPLARLLTAPAVLVSLGLFAAFVSIEVTTGGWLATVLEDARGVDDRLAGLSVGAFWGGITIGRLLLGRFDLPDRALLLGVGVLVISFTGLAVVPAPFVLPLALAAGVALAPQFPTLLAHTGNRVGEEAAGRVSGWQLIAANVAATSLAALTGVIVAATGPAAPLAVLVARRRGGRRSSSSSPPTSAPPSLRGPESRHPRADPGPRTGQAAAMRRSYSAARASRASALSPV